MRKSILNTRDKTPACGICAHGVLSPEGDSVLCIKTGIRLLDSSCRSFKYDPLKRVPMRDPAVGGFTEDDFKLTLDDSEFEKSGVELSQFDNDTEKDDLSAFDSDFEAESSDIQLDDIDSELEETEFHPITLKDL